MSGINISEDNILELFSRMLTDDRTNLQSVLSEIRYQGFDPIYCRALVITKIREGRITLNDIFKALSIYLNRGTKKEKILNKTSREGINVLNRVVEVLDLKFERPSVLKAGDLTLSRLSAAFPELVASILHAFPDLVKVRHPGLPVELSFPGGAALIPRSRDLLWDSWKEWAFDFNKVINPDQRTRAAPTEDQVKFWNITKESPLLNDDKRIALLVKLGIETSVAETFTPPSTSAPRSNIFTELMVDIPKGIQALTNSATSPIKTSGLKATYDMHISNIERDIKSADVTLGKSVKIDQLPDDLPHCPRMMCRLITLFKADHFGLWDGRIVFVKDNKLIKATDGSVYVINFTDKTISSMGESHVPLANIRWYCVVIESGTGKIRKKV